MTFLNDKKTFLAKLDKSRKGGIDQRILDLVQAINFTKDYYTTSSCSGRVYFWRGSGKKNETEWLKVSHEPIDGSFFQLAEASGLVWLRLEPMILHVACLDLDSANKLLKVAQSFYKKSCLLTASNKIIVEIRGSEHLEMPFLDNGKLLFSGDLDWLRRWINSRLEQIWKRKEMLRKKIEDNFLN